MIPENSLIAEFNVRASFYHVARLQCRCSRCGRPTTVFAIALPPEHETLIGDDKHCGSDTQADFWQRACVRAWIFQIEHLPLAVQRRLQAIAPLFRPEQGAAADGAYWTNHCAHCGASQPDDFLHCEPDAAFMPMSAHAAARVSLQRVDEPIGAYACGHAEDPPFLESMRGL